MSAPKFTPGPWCITPHGTVDAADRQIASVHNGGIINMANARLIAAAPELYGALEELANAADESLSCDHNELCPFAQRLRDAVIKARAELAAAVQP